MIRLSGVHLSFGSNRVLRGVDLHVPDGCLYGLIGPGASGKSVILKLMAGLLEPTRGTVVVAGRGISEMNDLELQQFRTKFGMLFQNNALFDYLTVGENIAASSIDRDDQHVTDMWLNSEGHCKLIMSPNFTHAGIGVGRDETRFTGSMHRHRGHRRNGS